MTAADCRRARHLLNITQNKLAQLSGVPLHAVTIFEAQGRAPAALDGFDRAAAIRNALEAAGVEFIEQNGGGPEVRLRGG